MSDTLLVWTLGFETPADHPAPYYTISGSADYVLGFAESVVAQGWTLTTVERV